MPSCAIAPDCQVHYGLDDFTPPWHPGETVVLHHGIAKSGLFWRAWAPVLAQTFRILRLDARGHGLSTPPPPGYSWSLAGLARDLKALLDALGIARAHVIGETLGGAVSLQFAHDYPERVTGLVLCTTPYSFTGPGQRYERLARTIESQGMEAYVRSSMDHRLEARKTDPLYLEWYIREMCKTPAHVAAGIYRSLEGVDLSPLLAGVRAPTLVLVGDSNTTLPLDRARRLRRLLPKARLKVFKGEAGYIQHAIPERCARAALRFLQRLPSSS